MNPLFFHAPISLHPLLCGSTLSPSHSLTFDLHLLMTLGYSCTCLIQFLIHNPVAPEDIHEHLNKLSFLYKHDEAAVTSH